MIGIVGGGVSGLFLLHFLREAGVPVVLFEADDIAGGVMRSRTVAGPDGPVTVELGPQRIRLTPSLSGVVESLDIESSLVVARGGLPFTMVHRGTLHPAPMNLRAAVGTRLISGPGKLRALRDLVTGPPRPTETVADALRRKLGREIYERLAGPILGGLYASDPEEMYSKDTLLRALARTGARRSLLRGLVRASRAEGMPVVSFERGLATLPLALAERHREHIRLGSPVVKVVPLGGGYSIVAESESIDVEQVVLTVPAPAAASILRSADPGTSDRLASLRYNPLAVVPLVVPHEIEPPSIGSGFKLTFGDPRATRGVTSHDALFGRRGLFTAFLGGRGMESVVALGDDEILAIAARDFHAITGAKSRPLMVHRTAMPAWDRSWTALEGLDLPDRMHLCTAYTDRPGVAGRLEQARGLARTLSEG